MMKRSIPVLLLLAVVLGCGGADGAIVPGAGVLGRYTLRTIDGSSLPFGIVNETAVRLLVLAGEFTLTRDGSVSGILDSRAEVQGMAPQTTRTTFIGSYSVSGTSISLTTVSTNNGVSSPSVTFQGTVGGEGTISLPSSDGRTYVYKR